MKNTIKRLDDSTRPEAPSLENVTAKQKLPGQHLAMIHEHFRQNMSHLRGLIAEAEDSAAGADAARAAAEAMPMLANYRRFGALCGQHCSIIHSHHSIEDQAIFPGLSEKGAAWKKVTDRLQAEHEVVHALLVKLIASLNALAQTPCDSAFRDALADYDALEEVLLSHFGYEERSIGDALGYYGIGV